MKTRLFRVALAALGIGLLPGIALSASDEAASDELAAAQKACLEQKIANKQKGKNSLAKRLGKVLDSVDDAPIKFDEAAIAEVTTSVYDGTASADEIAAAADKLGIGKKAIKQCENPPGYVPPQPVLPSAAATSPAPAAAVVASTPAPPPAAAAPAAGPGELMRLSKADFAGVPRNFMPVEFVFGLAQQDGAIAACAGSRNPVVRQNIVLIIEHARAAPSESADTRQAMTMYDQSFEHYRKTMAAACSEAVVKTAYDTHNRWMENVLRQAAEQKAASQPASPPAPAAAPSASVARISPAQVTAPDQGVTRGVLSSFGAIISDDVVTYICGGQRHAHKQNAMTIYQNVGWGHGRETLDEIMLNYDEEFETRHGQQAEIARRLDETASKYPNATPYCTDQRLLDSRTGYDQAMKRFTG
jgi:hypothetical protein